MKYLFAFLAIVTFSCFAPNLHAEPIVSLNTGAVADTLIETPVLGGEQYTYLDLNTDIFSTTLQTFTATFTDIAGLDLLNITDVCANVTIFIRPQSCKALAFSFTDVGLGDPTLLSALGLVGVNLGGDALGINFDASIGGGSTEIGFNPPPAVTPEPGTLGLLGTGMLGLAGVVRKRLVA